MLRADQFEELWGAISRTEGGGGCPRKRKRRGSEMGMGMGMVRQKNTLEECLKSAVCGILISIHYVRLSRLIALLVLQWIGTSGSVLRSRLRTLAVYPVCEEND